MVREWKIRVDGGGRCEERMTMMMTMRSSVDENKDNVVRTTNDFSVSLCTCLAYA